MSEIIKWSIGPQSKNYLWTANILSGRCPVLLGQEDAQPIAQVMAVMRVAGELHSARIEGAGKKELFSRVFRRM